MRYRHLLALATLIVAAGCGGSGVNKELGVSVYPGAKLKSNDRPFQHDGALIRMASFETKDPASRVDEFYARELGPNAVRTFRRSNAADTVSFTLNKPTGERIVIGIIDNKQRPVLVLIRHDLPQR